MKLHWASQTKQLGFHSETPELCNPFTIHLRGALWLQGTFPFRVTLNPHTGSEGSRARAVTLVYRGGNWAREAGILPEEAQLVRGHVEPRPGAGRVQLAQLKEDFGESGRGSGGHQAPNVHFIDEAT